MKNNKAQQQQQAEQTGKNLTLDQAISLNAALSSKGLKAKHLSGGNYLQIIKLKTLLRNELKALDEVHQKLAIDCGVEQIGPTQYRAADKEKQSLFTRKMREINKKWQSPQVTLNFIPESELKEFCFEQDVEAESILFEYLLKSEEVTK
jgi:hypothetical protein